MNYYEHHLGDYMRDTAHLSMLEDAAYRRLIDAYYVREKALPTEPRECWKLARATSKQERDAVDYVLKEFFELLEDGYHQRRCDEEIARFQDKQRKARASAEARWSHRNPQSEGNANADANASTDAMRTHSEGNAPRVHARTRAPARPQTPDTRHQPSSKAAGGGRGSRLPPDWDPGESGFAFAAAQGLTNGRAQAELAKFRDYWAAKAGADATKADWQATWRNWVRKAVEAAPGQRAPASSDPFAGAH